MFSSLAGVVERAVSQRVSMGAPGDARASAVARGTGWSVDDVVCNFGPADRPFEEQHNGASIALVLAGTFQYRTSAGREVLVPGSVLLGNHEQPFECSHDHAAGDRCLAFRFEPDYLERIAADAGITQRRFRIGRVPPLREVAALTARASAGIAGADMMSWEELAVDIAALTLRLAHAGSKRTAVPRGAESRVTASVREIERDPGALRTLDVLANRAALSPYHYLRTFQRVTGVTPHQFILRSRLRAAATQLATTSARIIDVAFASGFGDLSNFNHAFRAEFGMSPRQYRRAG